MLILFPLLGITNLLFFINPKSLKKKEHEFVYMVVNSVLKCSQVSFAVVKHDNRDPVQLINLSPGHFSFISLLLLQH